jgi:hypothetical protein
MILQFDRRKANGCDFVTELTGRSSPKLRNFSADNAQTKSYYPQSFFEVWAPS